MKKNKPPKRYILNLAAVRNHEILQVHLLAAEILATVQLSLSKITTITFNISKRHFQHAMMFALVEYLGN